MLLRRDAICGRALPQGHVDHAGHPKEPARSEADHPRHLFDLATNGTYRDNHSNMTYGFAPTADDGPGVKGAGGKK